MSILKPDTNDMPAPWFLPRSRIAIEFVRRAINKRLPGGKEPDKTKIPDYLK